MNKSLLISADMAHGVHPNYPEKHEDCHRPRFHKGLVIKYNSNQRYATNCSTAAYIKFLAQEASIPIQEFVVRNDSPCGSTIGPILSTRLGINTIGT
jgi:aspartyl aminopeptidase